MRRSPGSPSQMIAALLRRAERRWRSRQLTLALILPPTNHFACGGFQSSTVRPRLRTTRARAQSAPRTLRDRARLLRRCARSRRWPARGTPRGAGRCDLRGAARRFRRRRAAARTCGQYNVPCLVPFRGSSCRCAREFAASCRRASCLVRTVPSSRRDLVRVPRDSARTPRTLASRTSGTGAGARSEARGPMRRRR